MNCNIIGDLLPLFVDGICSEDSKTEVEKHIKNCPRCEKILKDTQNESIEDFQINKEEIIEKRTRFFKRKSAVAGAVCGGILTVPLIVCLIVNLAAGSALNWFFIVLAALLCSASVTVVPLMAEKNKWAKTVGTFSLSLVLLLGVITLYTKGNWFFVASSASLFGISFSVAPTLAKTKMQRLILAVTDTVLYSLMIISIGEYTSADFYSLAVPLSAYFGALMWLGFLLCNYLPLRTLTKWGISLTIFGTGLFFSEWAVGQIINSHVPLSFDLFHLMLLSPAIIGIILISVGGKK